jgi:hypothetical protein
VPRLNKINVELTVPLIGKIGGEWAPDEAERQAAWEMYVEIATRITVQPLAAGEGLIRGGVDELLQPVRHHPHHPAHARTPRRAARR